LGLGKILWHKGFDDAQLGIFIKQPHVFFQESRDVIRGHIDGFLALDSRIFVASGFADSSMVCQFLVTNLGLVSFYFAIETFVFLHEFKFPGFISDRISWLGLPIV